MLRALFVQLILISVSYSLIGCAPAPYRGWSEGSQYFKTENKEGSQDKSSANTTTSDSSDCSGSYTVRSGDTLSEIALKCGVSLTSLAKENDLYPPYTLYVKQLLVVSSDSDKSIRPPGVISKGDLPNPSFVWPVAKQIKYEFVKDLSGVHGLKLFAELGEPVYAMNGGEVVYAGNGIKQYGSMLVIKHDNDYLTVYAHNDTLQVAEGDQVAKKQLIATIGHTGQVLTPQLYVEVRYRGRKVDAKQLLVAP